MGETPAASPYGLMQIRSIRGCAYAALGELDKARADLAYAIAHEKDDPATVTALDLCVGDEEGAAASYINQHHSSVAPRKSRRRRRACDLNPSRASAPVTRRSTQPW